MIADDPIRHVVLLMLENHSFDQMVGTLQSVHSELDGVDIESPTSRFNLDLLGNKVFQAPTIAARAADARRADSARTAAPTKIASSATLNCGECAGIIGSPSRRAPMRRKHPRIDWR